MCTYNGSRYLREQLESITSQTASPEEIIICDDGSTDTSLDILNEFASQAPFPVRIFSNEVRLGPAQNFEKAIRLCVGEIIVLSDQDDIWKPQKLERLSAVFERHPDSAYAFSDAEMVDRNGGSLGQTLWDAVGIQKKLERFVGPGQVELLLRHNLIPGAAMAFRASFRSIILPIPSAWMHDYWIVLLGSVLSSGVPVQEALFKYRRHASQLCGWRKQTYWEVLRRSLETTQEEWWAKVENFRKLTERISSVSDSVSSPGECLRLLREKDLHLSSRARIRSTTGMSKVMRVLAETASGRYQRFSDSWQSVIRDIT